jgi:ubiquitin-protein ligase
MEEMQNVFANCTYTGNNCIIPEYMQNSHIVELLIDNACYALNCNRVANIFEPIPETWKQANINPENAIKHFNLCTDSNKIIADIISSSSDEILIAKIGENTYGFIKFVISTYQSNGIIGIIPYKLFTSASTECISNQYKFQYKFIYTQDIENLFSKQKTIYLYHGSPYENWYSIMRTGIKIGSTNKKLFLNGAVHGNGIYLSNDINLSLGYTNTNTNTNNTNTFKVLAIYEVIDNPNWKKTENIFVINDENALILRYIIVLNNSTLPIEICTTLNNKLQSGKLKEFELEKTKESDLAMSKAYSKRLMIEYKKLIKKTQDDTGLTIKLPEEGNLRKWHLFIHKVNNDNLATQMAKLNITYIEMEFTFPETYPIEPPFIKIITPQFESLPGSITTDNHICIKLLDKTSWIPTTSVEDVINQIKLIFSDRNIFIRHICKKID